MSIGIHVDVCTFLQSAFVVAFANIQIPLQLGEVVNRLTTFATHEQVGDFWNLMKEPVYKISITYLLQV